MFSKGDRVFVLDDDIEGIVAEVSGGQITVETADGFLMKFAEKELIKIHDTSILNKDTVRFNSAEIQKQKEEQKRPKAIPEKVRGEIPPPEFDLHIEKLAKNWRGMSNYEILTLQSETAQRHIEFAIRNRIPKIIFIHGVGEGILKAELDFMLGRYDNLVFHDANYQKYGGGATEIVFKQSSK
jgi:dsDNA-specific endonuclease/ATPase MutS2